MKETKKKTAPTPHRSGTFDKAVADYEKAVKLIHKQSYDQAKDQLEQVLEKHSGELEICERATMYLRFVARHLQPKPRPKDADDYYLLGQLEHNAGDYEAAVKDHKKAQELAPGDDRITYALAATYARQGKTDEAMAALREAVARSRENRFLAFRDEDFDIFDESDEFLELTQQLDEAESGA